METLNEKFIKSLIRPGDLLLFDKPGLVSWVIKRKRGEKYAHVEVAISPNEVVASRNGIGVGRYALDLHGLAAIYRTRTIPNIEAGMEWFTREADGQGYDFIGLLAFTWAVFRGRDNRRMFCSEFATRFLRACGVKLFGDHVDADAISPEMLTYSYESFEVWLRKDKRKKNG